MYSFGLLVLEALTGKVRQSLPDEERKDKKAVVSLPEWCSIDVELLRYKNIEEEMVALLHIALACVAQLPEQRPSMADVVRMIESVPVDQSPLPEEDVSMSPSVGITSDDGLSY